jgi:riboflavin kinase/FMN adenylyltransferase
LPGLEEAENGGYHRAVLICHRLEELPALGQTLHLALGVFDGVHLGHQAVIGAAVKAARRDGGLAGLLTFDPHPIRVIAPGKAPASLLETLEHKARVVGGLGVELLIPLHFDAAMAAMEAAEFVARLTAAPVRTITVGEDWRFGHKRAGDVNLLRNEAETRNFRLEAVPPVMFEGDRISSTRIRQAIHDGNLDEAARMLGRRYSVTGIVEKGRQLGRQLGFPTANVATGNLQLPPDGVWAVRVIDASGRQWDGVANLGMRPTVGGVKRLLEVHVFGFSGEIYGETLEICFEKHLRREMKFSSLELLRVQISKDAQAARESLA